MQSQQEKAQYSLWFHETKSPVTVQCKFVASYERRAPDVKSIKRWYEIFKETGSIQDLSRSGRLSMSEANVDRVWQAFRLSPSKLTH